MQAVEPVLTPIHKLDDQARHRRLMGWFVAEVYRQRSNRQRMAKCEGYYDQYQYDARRKQEIEARGQQAIVFDRTAPQIDFLIGTERRTRIDYRVDPRNGLDEATVKDATTKTDVMKWLDATSDSAFERSTSFAGAMKAGLGWIEVCADIDHSSGSPVLEVAVSWREILHDSFGSTHNPQTMRYIFRIKVVDLDIAIAHLGRTQKTREALLRVRQDAASLDTMTTWMTVPGDLLDLQALFGGTGEMEADGLPLPMANMFNGRERVLLLEAWTMEPMPTRPDGTLGTLGDPIKLRPYVTIMTEHEILLADWSPYKHGRYPFVPVWAYREARTGLPYGPIRRAMDKQDGLNNTMSRAHFEIASKQLMIEEGAYDAEVMDVEEIRAEFDDPNGTIVLAAGGIAKVKELKGFEEAKAHMSMAALYTTALDESNGITRENTGRDTQPMSGIARQVKENQGAIITAELFDNLLMAHKWAGELKLSLVEQYMNQPLAIPIPGERGQHKMLAINQQRPDGTWENDITERAARFVISEQPWRASLAAAQFEQMMTLLTQLAAVTPQVVVAVLDLVFEFADIPNKQTFLERIRSVTGTPGPNNQMTPEQEKAKAQQAQLAEAQFQATLQTTLAQVKEAQAKGQKLENEAVLKALESLYASAQAAQIVRLDPTMAPIMDELLASAGFQDKNPAASVTETAGTLPPPQPAGPVATEGAVQ